MQNFYLLQDAVGSLKNSLKDILPKVVGSSHLSEAIASGFGYQSNAAYRFEVSRHHTPGWQEFKPNWFLMRLEQLCPTISPISHQALEVKLLELTRPSPDFYQALENVRILEAISYKAVPRGAMYNARLKCAEIFAKAFMLGYVASETPAPTKVVKSFTPGVEHQHAIHSWGSIVDDRNPMLEFDGTDHRLWFYEQLPLSKGKYVEYCSGMVSMPYWKAHFSTEEQLKGIRTAQLAGWDCIELPQWSWYAAGETSLFLYKRRVSRAVMLARWETSFQKWLYENRARLRSNSSDARRKVYDDVTDCQHFPLTVTTWEELRDVYLEQFIGLGYGTNPLLHALGRLFEKWRKELG